MRTAHVEALSLQAQTPWAKSPDLSDEKRWDWYPLYRHMLDTADIAEYLLRDWASRVVLTNMAASCDTSVESLRRVIVFLACAHDIGKATPAFQIGFLEMTRRPEQQRQIVDQLHDVGLDVGTPDRCHHTLSGQLALEDWLIAKGFDYLDAATWGTVIGGHHGRFPKADSVVGAATDAAMGDQPWDEVRNELLDFAWTHAGLDETDDIPHALVAHAQSEITGLVAVADWAASNTWLMPPREQRSARRTRVAVRRLALSSPWKPSLPHSASQLYTDRFHPAEDEPINEIQKAAFDVASTISAPGLLLFEAAMGGGKSRAALIAAEVLAARFGQGGIQFALPTMATSDSMFNTVYDWKRSLPAGEMDPAAQVWLGHGLSALNETYSSLPSRGMNHPVDVDCSDKGGTINQWLDEHGASHMAPVSVTTIDQLLYSTIPSWHVGMRHLGLAGRVVVIDEVHAFDAYTGAFLNTLLDWLGSMRVPVVMLSATLPPSRRQELLDSYAGRASGDAVREATNYPAVFSVTRGGNAQVVPISDQTQPKVLDIVVHGDDVSRTVAEVTRLVNAGACVALVCNTVSRAQSMYSLIRSAVGASRSALAHSGFTNNDRHAKDTWLTDRFGKKSTTRPAGFAVVATQVIEQSLDIDFDAMFTDLAPLDLVLQRAGRLHRHDREHRPAAAAGPVLYLTGFTPSDNGPPEVDKGSRKIYGHWPLLRAASVLHGRTSLRLPDQIAPLVRQAYEGDECPEGWGRAIAAARKDFDKDVAKLQASADQFRNSFSPDGQDSIGGMNALATSADDNSPVKQATVRYGPPSVETTLLIRHPDGTLRLPDWIDSDLSGAILRTDQTPAPETVQAMLRCSLRLPIGVVGAAGGYVSGYQRVWDELTSKENLPSAWLEIGTLSRRPPLVFDTSNQTDLGDAFLFYDRNVGLSAVKKDDVNR